MALIDAWAGVPAAAFPAYRALVKGTEDHTPPCTMDPELWFSTDRRERVQAARHCLTCPLLQECDSYLTASNEPHGVLAARLPEDRTRRVTDVQGRTAPDHRERLVA